METRSPMLKHVRMEQDRQKGKPVKKKSEEKDTDWFHAEQLNLLVTA